MAEASSAGRWNGGQERDEALGQFLLTLRTRGFRAQPLLNAIERAPRTDFVATEHVGFAYHDIALPLPCGQETGRPIAIVEALQALELEPHHHVLEIGTGSGWQTALIAGLAGAVASVERWHTLADAADLRLQRAGFQNAVVVHGDGEGGLPAAGPFDRIIFNVAIEEVSPLILAQLAGDGLLVAPLAGRRQMLTRFRRRSAGIAEGDALTTETLGPSDAPPLMSGAAENL